jgi:diguanylate cyclase (GGDEF)-like protein
MPNADSTTDFLETREPLDEFSATTPAFLVVLNGKAIGTYFTIDRGKRYVGRSGSAHIQLKDQSVSRLHARVWTASGGVRLQDLGSRNGTYLNGARISESALSNGDILRIGRISLKYLCGRNVEHEFHREIYRLYTTDSLTNTFNREYLFDFLERELVSRERHGHLLSVAMFDIDHFKQINDNFGHALGDEVLRGVADSVRRNLRKSDLLARYGGDEFCVVLAELDRDQACLACERLRRLVAEKRFRLGEKTLSVTITLGLCSVDVRKERPDVSQIIAQADAYLVQAKRSGRNRTGTG